MMYGCCLGDVKIMLFKSTKICKPNLGHAYKSKAYRMHNAELILHLNSAFDSSCCFTHGVQTNSFRNYIIISTHLVSSVLGKMSVSWAIGLEPQPEAKKDNQTPKHNRDTTSALHDCTRS